MSWTTAPFDELYPGDVGDPKYEVIDARLITDPPLAGQQRTDRMRHAKGTGQVHDDRTVETVGGVLGRIPGDRAGVVHQHVEQVQAVTEPGDGFTVLHPQPVVGKPGEGVVVGVGGSACR